MQTCNKCKYMYYEQATKIEQNYGIQKTASCGKYKSLIAKFHFPLMWCISRKKAISEDEPNLCGYYKEGSDDTCTILY